MLAPDACIPVVSRHILLISAKRLPARSNQIYLSKVMGRDDSQTCFKKAKKEVLIVVTAANCRSFEASSDQSAVCREGLCLFHILSYFHCQLCRYQKSSPRLSVCETPEGSFQLFQLLFPSGPLPSKNLSLRKSVQLFSKGAEDVSRRVKRTG